MFDNGIYTTDINFFLPDDEFVQWIMDYADGRGIVEIGCGQGHLADKLLGAGLKQYLACDPFGDYMNMMQLRMKHSETISSFHFFPKEVGDPMCQTILGGLGKTSPEKYLFIVARPCHTEALIHGAIETAGNCEILYIGLPKNFNLDLDDYDFEILDHNGTSPDGELVLQIQK